MLDPARRGGARRDEHDCEQQEHPSRALVVEEQQQDVPDGDELRRATERAPEQIAFQAQAAAP